MSMHIYIKSLSIYMYIYIYICQMLMEKDLDREIYKSKHYFELHTCISAMNVILNLHIHPFRYVAHTKFKYTYQV